MSNTRKSVSSEMQTLVFEVKKTWLSLIFSMRFSVFGYLMKHSSFCLTFYLLNLVVDPNRALSASSEKKKNQTTIMTRTHLST